VKSTATVAAPRRASTPDGYHALPGGTRWRAVRRELWDARGQVGEDFLEQDAEDEGAFVVEVGRR
jgi:hypothetical protein